IRALPHFLDLRGVVRKVDAEIRKFVVVNGVRLRAQDPLGFFLLDVAYRFTGGGDVVANVGHDADAAVEILGEKKRAELGIQKITGQDDKTEDQQNGHQRNKEIGDDQPIAQAPQQPAAAPSDDSHHKI